MRSVVFREINLDDLDKYPVEPSELTPWENLVANFRIAIKNVPFLGDSKYLDKQLRERINLINEIKIVILDVIAKKLQDRNEVIVCIPRYSEEIIKDVLGSTEFLGFRKVRIHEDNDYFLSFPDMPILIRFEVK